MLGTRPSGAYQGYRPLSQTKSETDINDAASIWSGRDPNHPIWQGQTVPLTFNLVSASPDVTIQGYWNPVGTQLPNKCGNSVACTHPGGTYPHLGHQDLWLEYPPQFSMDPDYKRWTNDLSLATNNSDNYVYLPGVMMHELGHTAGLGHPAGVGIMGGDLVRSAPLTYDKNGMKYIYQGHTHSAPEVPVTPFNTAGQGQIAVSWTAPGNGGSAITSYLVQWRAKGGTWVTTASGQASVTAGTTYTIAGLTDGTTYEVRVAAVNEVGSSGWSATAPVTPTAPRS